MRLTLPFEYSGAEEAEAAWVQHLITEGVESVSVQTTPTDDSEPGRTLVKSANGLIDPRKINIFEDPRREGLR